MLKWILPSSKEWKQWKVPGRVSYLAGAAGVVTLVGQSFLVPAYRSLRPEGEGVLSRDAFEWYVGTWEVDSAKQARVGRQLHDSILAIPGYRAVQDSLIVAYGESARLDFSRVEQALYILSAKSGSMRRGGTSTIDRHLDDSTSTYKSRSASSFVDFRIEPVLRTRARVIVTGTDFSMQTVDTPSFPEGALVQEGAEVYMEQQFYFTFHSRQWVRADTSQSKTNRFIPFRIYLRRLS